MRLEYEKIKFALYIIILYLQSDLLLIFWTCVRSALELACECTVCICFCAGKIATAHNLSANHLLRKSKK